MKLISKIILASLLMLLIAACTDSTEVAMEHDEHEEHTDEEVQRTTIAADVAASLGIQTAIAGPQIIEKTVQAYGRVVANSEKISHVSARFDGRIKDVFVKIGERVNAGARLATIESNQSLTDYELTAPIGGIILTREAGPGEQSAGRELFTILDDSAVWVDLALFPQQRAQVSQGAVVHIDSAFDEQAVTARIERFLPQRNSDQSTTARVTLPNPNGFLQPGTWVDARIEVSEREVALAVRRSALQSFREFTVVFAQFGDQYEVRMLELGEMSDEWVEVRGGITAGTPYVTENSFIIKADIEKSGATHDH